MSKRVNLNVVHFDGSNDSVVVGDHDALSFTDGNTDLPFTITAWVFVPDVSEDHGPIVSKADMNAGSARMEILLRQNSSGDIEFYLYDDVSADVGGNWNSRIYIKTQLTQLTDSTWHHVAATYDGSKNVAGMNIYVDGDLTAVNRLSSGITDENPAYVRLRNTTVPLMIGGQTNPASDPHIFEEKMADVCIFNKELTAAEISEVYNAGKVKNMTKASTYSNLISWWKMGDDQDTTGTGGIKDYVGGFNGTLTNGASIVAYPSLATDRIRSEGHVYTSWGRTRQPKNIAGDHAVYIHGGLAGAMPKIDPVGASAGYVTENQRFLHLRWKAEQTNKTHEITVYGYSHASGAWSPLYDKSGTQVKLNTTDAAVDMVRVFEVSGVDRVYFKSTGEDDLLATDLFAAATSTF